MRVPTENVKLKQQTGVYPNFKAAIRGINASQGAGGYYVGYGLKPPPKIPPTSAFGSPASRISQLYAALPHTHAACSRAVLMRIECRLPLRGISPFHVFRHLYDSSMHDSSLLSRYMSTVMREIPFAFIQFPIWEKLKKIWAEKQGAPVAGWQSALCGSLSGGFAAAVTTPLDVAKTRLMLDSTGK